MGDTLNTKITAWRSENQGGNGHSGLLSKLTIDGSLYDIKDPAVDYLAQEVETRLSAIEGSTIRETALNDTAVAGQFITSVSQGVDGQVSITRAGVNASNVTFDPTNTDFESTTTNVQAALVEALTKALALKGTSNDGASAETIAGAKAYADAAVQVLAGQDWSENAKKVQEIIAELENSENGNAWSTAIDKLAGLGIKTPAVYYTQEECDEYNTENSLSPGDDGYRTTSDIKTPAVYNTVKDYVDSQVAAAESAASGGISDLDAVIYSGSNGSTDNATAATSYTNDTTSQVAIKLTETDGVITGIDIKTNDIASATDLTTANTAITALQTGKANKAALTTAQVNNWSASYLNENLTWTNTPATVYVPVSGQTL